jgi:predicted dehydrogenase
MGGGLRACRALIDAGEIGEPVAGAAFMLCSGHEGWHPDPAFYYKPGGGPLFDMGPYYLTALVSLLGPIERVTSSSRASRLERVIGSGPKKGGIVTVETPTHVAGTLEFASGPIVTLVMSFDVAAHGLPHIEVYGTNGTLSTPDPNTFDGPVHLRRDNTQPWSEVPITSGYTDNARGLGLCDLIEASRTGREPVASGRTGGVALHVLEAMSALLRSAEEGRRIELSTTCMRPAIGG